MAKVYFVSLGCDKNLVDTEVMLALLDEKGHEITNDEYEADVIVISGMGGELIKHILENDYDTVMQSKLIVLQPQKDYEILRKHLSSNYRLIDEDMVLDDGKFYPIITVHPELNYQENFSDLESYFGRILLKKKHPVLKKYLEKQLLKQQDVYDNITSNSKGNDNRILEIKYMLELIKEANIYVSNS